MVRGAASSLDHCDERCLLFLYPPPSPTFLSIRYPPSPIAFLRTVTHPSFRNDASRDSQVRINRTDTSPEQQFGAHHAASAEIKSRGRASSAT